MTVRSSEVLTTIPVNLSCKTLRDRLKKYSSQINVSTHAYYDVESTWTELIDHNELDRDACNQQQGIFEFIQTERNYILKLRAVCQIYEQIFLLAKSSDEYDDFQDINIRTIFANIKDIFLTNDDIWMKYIYTVLEHTRKSKRPIDPCAIFAPFQQAEEVYQPYIVFCLQQRQCIENIRKYTDASSLVKEKGAEDFAIFIEFCEKLPQCNQWKLVDLMIEPMKRMTLYPLLFKSILKRTQCDTEKEFLKTVIMKIEQFVLLINTTIRRVEEDKKLQVCLDSFDEQNVWPVGTEEMIWSATDFLRSNINIGHRKEQRCILKKVQMKIVEDGKKKIDIEVLLFSDVLVLLRQRRTNKQFTVVRQLYFLDKLVVKRLTQHTMMLVYLNEVGLLSELLVLAVPVTTDQDRWIELFEKAKRIYIHTKNNIGSTLDIFKEQSRLNSEDQTDGSTTEDEWRVNGTISKRTTAWHLTKDGVKYLGCTPSSKKVGEQDTRKISTVLANTVRRAISESNLLDEGVLDNNNNSNNTNDSYMKKSKLFFNSLRERKKSTERHVVHKKHSFNSHLTPPAQEITISVSSAPTPTAEIFNSFDDVFNDETESNGRDSSLDGELPIAVPLETESTQDKEKTSASIEIQTDISFSQWFFHKKQTVPQSSNNNEPSKRTNSL